MQTVGALDPLATMAPGAGLAAALAAVEPAAVPNDRMLEVLQAQYRQLCHEQARMAAVVAELGRCAGFPEPGQVTRLPVPAPYAAAETRAALRWTRRAADAEHEFAEAVVHAMPLVFAAWLAGEIDRPRVRVFDRYLTGLTAAQVRSICRAALPRAPRLTTGRLASLLQRMVIAVDPEAAARWYRRGIRERDVVAYAAPDGTITVSANGLPADEAEAACVRLQDLAEAAKQAGHPGLISQIRCDLFLGMLDGRFHHMTTAQVINALIADHRDAGPADPDRASGGQGDGSRAERTGGDPVSVAPQPDRPARDERVGIEIRVGLGTLLCRGEHPAEISGLAVLPAPDARLRVALQHRAEWRFAVTDADGTLVSEGLTRRRPRGPQHDGPGGGIVELHVPLTLLQDLTAAGPTAGGAWSEVIADIAAQHARRDAHLADLDARPCDRLPHAALRRHTEIRDRTCTFVGCRRPAHRADQDHTRDHRRGGATLRGNLGALCRHDHRVKHNGGWQVAAPEPGTFVWRSPLGGEYVTRGAFLQPEMPEPSPVELPPRFDELSTPVEGPILRRLPPDPPRRRRPPVRRDDSDDPPPF